MDNIIFLQMSQDELKELIGNVLRQELNRKEEKQLLNFKEVCKVLDISASTLNKLKSENKIPFKKLGKRVLFDRSEIMSALKDSGLYKKQIELKAANE